MRTSQHDSNLLNHIYTQLYNKLTHIYEQYLESNDLEFKYSLELPSADQDVCKNLKHVIHLNQVGPVEILRINIQTPLISLRAKCLYNRDSQESFINLIDFSINKIQLRSGGVGSKVINCVFEVQRLWLQEEYGVDPPTRITVFKFLSLPFWVKNDFAFRWMIDVNSEDNKQNTVYKFFKLLIIMNKIQDIGCLVQNFELFSTDSHAVDDILRRWINAYHGNIFNDNLWVRKNIINQVGSQVCDEFVANNNEFCTRVVYSNVCNQLENDELCNLNIMNILWELFYLERVVGKNEQKWESDTIWPRAKNIKSGNYPPKNEQKWESHDN